MIIWTFWIEWDKGDPRFTLEGSQPSFMSHSIVLDTFFHEDSVSLKTKELIWGLQAEKYDFIGSKEVIAFCFVKYNMFASSDGERICIWTTSSLLATINILATSLVYIDRINHLVAYSKELSCLYFVWLKNSYPIRKHPLHFSNRVINHMHYFPKSSNIACFGEGLFISHMIIPNSFKKSNPIPETLQFSQYSDLYQSMKFDFSYNVCISETNELIFIVDNASIIVHMSTGEVLSELKNVTDSPILSITYFEEKSWIIVSSMNGTISGFLFKSNQIRIAFSVSQRLANINFMHLINPQFLVFTTNEKKICLYDIIVCKMLFFDHIEYDPKAIRYFHSRVFVFSEKRCTGYFANVFTDYFKEICSDCTFYKRIPSTNLSSRYLSKHVNDTICVYSNHTQQLLFELKPSATSGHFEHVLYSRDSNVDVESWKANTLPDSMYIMFQRGPILELCFDQISITKRFKSPSHLMLTSSNGISHENMIINMIPLPPDLKFVKLLRIDDPRITPCLCGVCSNGLICLFSIFEKIFLSAFSSNYIGITISEYSSDFQCLICCNSDTIFLVDIYKRTVVNHVHSANYSSLMIIEKEIMVCGSNNGAIELRTLPGLTLKASSYRYGAMHSQSSRSLNKDSKHSILDQKYSVQFLDYCSPRSSILSATIMGEIILWDLDLFPLQHFVVPFELSSCCFKNGKGSVYLVYHTSILVINWKRIFDIKLTKKVTDLDDYDLRDDLLIETNSQTKKKKSKIISFVFKRPNLINIRDHLEFDQNVEELGFAFKDLIVVEDIIPKKQFAKSKSRWLIDSSGFIFISPRIEISNIDSPKMKTKKADNVKNQNICVIANNNPQKNNPKLSRDKIRTKESIVGEFLNNLRDSKKNDTNFLLSRNNINIGEDENNNHSSTSTKDIVFLTQNKDFQIQTNFIKPNEIPSDKEKKNESFSEPQADKKPKMAISSQSSSKMSGSIQGFPENVVQYPPQKSRIVKNSIKRRIELPNNEISLITPRKKFFDIQSNHLTYEVKPIIPIPYQHYEIDKKSKNKETNQKKSITQSTSLPLMPNQQSAISCTLSTQKFDAQVSLPITEPLSPIAKVTKRIRNRKKTETKIINDEIMIEPSITKKKDNINHDFDSIMFAKYKIDGC